mmetsp:Transcript_27346/g.50168  ORF Transcript_27346/g.50168 Transcript_27346/m.50168 type:complete len:261 (+) Transcript_27346:4880-5662(+)
MGDHVAVHVLGVDEICHAKIAPGFFLVVVQIHADDLVRARKAQPLDHVETNAPQTKDHAARANLDLGGVDDGPDAGGHAAANVADFVKGRVLAHLGQRDLWHNGVIGKGRAAHVVVDRRPIQHRKPRRAIGQQALSLRDPDFLAEVGLARQAILALSTFRSVEGDDVVANLKRRDALAHLQNNAGTLMPQNGRKDALGIVARTGEFVGVTQARGLDLDQHFAFARAIQIDLHDFKRFASGNSDCGASFHHGFGPPSKFRS